jgi:NAD(P)-dependent dehydrogenase (short-subunit alcohol dehydrogenase family)
VTASMTDLQAKAEQPRFTGRRVLVTGAGAGIGAATVRRFVAEGATVFAVDVRAEALEARQHELGQFGSQCTPMVADVTADEAVADIVGTAGGTERVLDVLVNNAAVFLLAGREATSYQWERTLAVNLLAPARLVAAAATALGRSGRGAVVNVASISGHVAQAGRWTYNASKGGLLELTRCQALDLAADGVRVNSVSPGFIWTDVLDRSANGDRGRWEKIWGSYSPLSRCGEPEEVAAAIAFLASDDASYITGTDLHVDGGQITTSAEGATKYEFES